MSTWAPAPLLCKRFGVENPYKNGGPKAGTQIQGGGTGAGATAGGGIDVTAAYQAQVLSQLPSAMQAAGVTQGQGRAGDDRNGDAAGMRRGQHHGNRADTMGELSGEDVLLANQRAAADLLAAVFGGDDEVEEGAPSQHQAPTEDADPPRRRRWDDRGRNEGDPRQAGADGVWGLSFHHTAGDTRREPPGAGVGVAASRNPMPRGAVGRGVGMTMPAWMDAASAAPTPPQPPRASAPPVIAAGTAGVSSHTAEAVPDRSAVSGKPIHTFRPRANRVGKKRVKKAQASGVSLAHLDDGEDEE